MSWQLSQGVRDQIQRFLADLYSVSPEVMGVAEIIPGCRIVDIPVGALPKAVVAKVNDYNQEVLWRGSPAELNAGDYVSVIHMREGNVYEILGASGTGGTFRRTFLSLTDTPSSYTGHGGKWVVVDVAEGALEFLVKDHGLLSGLDDDDHSAVYPAYAQAETITGIWTFNEEIVMPEQAADPAGAANTGKLYTKDDGAGNTELYYIDESGNVSKLTPPNGGGASTFLALTDTPANYVGHANKLVMVNAAENALEFSVVHNKATHDALGIDADTLDTYHAVAFPRKAEVATITANFWTFDNKIEVAKDADTASFFGRAAVGYAGYADCASFAHLDCNSAGNYALLQTAVGATFLNASTGNAIYFRVNHGNIMTMTSSLFDILVSTRAAYDSNITSYMGRAAIGYCGTSDWASFAHVDSNTTTAYALCQLSDGTTYLNCKSGKWLYLSTNGFTPIVSLISTGVYCAQHLYLTGGSAIVQSLALGCRVWRSSAQTIPNNDWTALSFNAELYDTDACWAIGAPTRLYATHAGYYSAAGNAQFTLNTTGQRGIGIRVNGGTTWLNMSFYDAVGAVANVLNVAGTMFYMAAGDYIEIMVYQNSGGNLNTSEPGGNVLYQHFANGALAKVV